jgi:hypothetical protein
MNPGAPPERRAALRVLVVEDEMLVAAMLEGMITDLAMSWPEPPQASIRHWLWRRTRRSILPFST